ncbi:MAG TPA: MFS transporter [Saprospiraceae bacterium]|nr:MFS transporter [Saprospiraceae bacterium]
MKSIKQYKHYPWVVVGLLWVVALLNYLDRQMLSTMKNQMMIDIAELSTAENFGRLMAVFLWIYALMSPVAGLIADRISKKSLIVGSLFVWSLITLLMGYAQTFDQLYILRAFMGLSEALYIPAGLSLIADYHQDKTRSLATGLHMTGLYFGQALGGFGATISDKFSWQFTFQSFGMIGVAYSIVLILFLYDYKPVNSANNKSLKSSDFNIASLKNSLATLLGTLSFWVILFYFTAPSFPGWAIKNWIPTLFSQSLSIDMTLAGPLSTISIAASSFIGVIAGGILSDRWVKKSLKGRIFTGALGLSMTIPALLFLGFGQSLIGVIGGAVLFGIGFGMFDANNMPILCQFVSSKYRAAGYGLMNMTGVIAGAFITDLLGKSTDAGSLGRDISFLAIPVCIAIGLLLTTLKPKTINMVE